MIAHGELEALVLNLTIVRIDRGETCGRTNLLNQQQVLGVLHEVVERDVPVVEECKVDTDVGHLGGLPLQVGIHQRSKPTSLTRAVAPVARHTIATYIEGVGSITAQGCDTLTSNVTSVTGLTPAETQLQVVHSLNALHERLLRDAPCTCQ